MKKFWILTCVENYEDWSVLGIFTTLKKGKDAMKRYYMEKKIDLADVSFYEDTGAYGGKSYTSHSKGQSSGSGSLTLQEIEIDKDVFIY